MNKQLPLKFLQLLNSKVEANKDIIIVVNNPSVLLQIEDKEPQSEFIFIIDSIEPIGRGEVEYEGLIIPDSIEDLSEYTFTADLNATLSKIDDWIEIIKSYNRIPPLATDSILQSYEEKFVKEFDILDDDADTAPFNLEQQLFLDEYLVNAEKKIQILKEGKDDYEIERLEELTAIAESIRKNITKSSKRELIKGLAKFWAKAQKEGLPILKEIFINVAAEISKKLLIGDLS